MRKNIVLAGLLVAICCLFAATGAVAGDKWAAKGTYVEGCSCMGVCPCELTGVKDGCEGVGALSMKKGSIYMGADIGGAKIVYATAIGQWVKIYVDAKDPQVSKAAKAFASAYYKGFGKVESAEDATIDFSGEKGKYTVLVDGGKIMKFVTEPVLGGDKKTPISHTNIHSDLNPTVMQGKTVSASYKDGDKSITLEGSNSYFNPNMSGAGAF